MSKTEKRFQSLLESSTVITEQSAGDGGTYREIQGKDKNGQKRRTKKHGSFFMLLVEGTAGASFVWPSRTAQR